MKKTGELARTSPMARVFKVWRIFSPGLSSKPSFGRVNANDDHDRLPARKCSRARADRVHESVSRGWDAALSPGPPLCARPANGILANNSGGPHSHTLASLFLKCSPRAAPVKIRIWQFLNFASKVLLS